MLRSVQSPEQVRKVIAAEVTGGRPSLAAVATASGHHSLRSFMRSQVRELRTAMTLHFCLMSKGQL